MALITPRVLVTGANGFIGRVLCDRLRADGHVVREGVRSTDKASQRAKEVAIIGDIQTATDWKTALQGVDVVYHLAAHAHIMHAADHAAFRSANRDGTLRLAEQAIAHGVQRFVFVSTIGVHGDHTGPGLVFNEVSPLQPCTPYAASKLEAEKALGTLADQLEIVIVRPPLVYGPNAPGNIHRLISALQRGIPLPLTGIKNKRSMIGIRNLSDFLSVCAVRNEAIGQTFVISDGQDISTTELVVRLGKVLHHAPQLFYVPEFLVRAAAGITRQERLLRQLWDSLVVDSQKARIFLNWEPPFNLLEEIVHLGEEDQILKRTG